MYILNGFVSIFILTYRGVRSIFMRGQHHSVGERSPLLHQHSLTSDFKDYGHSTRALRTCLLHALAYYVLGIVLFSFVVEKWKIVDSLYYATVLFTTIGYGDICPTSDASRMATIALAFYGIIILGIFLGIYGGSIVDANNERVEKQKKNVKKKMLENMDSSFRETKTEEVTGKEPSLLHDMFDVLVLEGPILIVVLVCGLLLGYFEGWTLLESLYWTVITGTTVGFGDNSPKVPGVRAAAIVFLPFSVAVLGEFLGRVAGVYLERKTLLAEKKFLEHSLTLTDIRTMDADKDGKVDKAEFLSYMLVTLQRVDQEEIDKLLHLFDKLDVDKSGALDQEDLRVNVRQGLEGAHAKANANAPKRRFEV